MLRFYVYHRVDIKHIYNLWLVKTGFMSYFIYLYIWDNKKEHLKSSILHKKKKCNTETSINLPSITQPLNGGSRFNFRQSAEEIGLSHHTSLMTFRV